MRLDRYLSNLGLGSRETVKKMIKSGRISVNGEVERLPERHIGENDTVCLDEEAVNGAQFEYYMLHKPAGYLSAVRDARDPVVMHLVKSGRKDLAPVGRLDKDAEGLLLITNDGALAHRLLSPKNEVPKTYFFETDGPLKEDAEDILSHPVVFKEFTSRPAFLQTITETSGRITVFEGKYHEVKRLIHHVGAEVIYLRREAFAGLFLGDLPRGKVRPLTEEEIRTLKAHT